MSSMGGGSGASWSRTAVTAEGVWWLVLGGAATVLLGALIAVVLLRRGRSEKKKPQTQQQETKVVSKKKDKTADQAAKKKAAKSKGQQKEEHRLLLGQLRSHENEVLSMSFSASGSMFASLGEDRTIRLCQVKDMTAKDVKTQRTNLEDHGDLIALSKDAEYLYLVLPLAVRSIRIFSIKKGGDTKVHLNKVRDVATKHKSDIKTIYCANNNKFFLTCSESDTLVTIWNMQGDELATVDTKKIKNNMACISPDSRFFTVGTFSGDVKIWEVTTAKGSDSWSFNGVAQAMVLINGHKSAVNDLCFSGDSKKIVTCSKDGTWKMWDLAVRYAQKEDPKLLYSITVGKPIERIALSPDGKAVAISLEGELHFYNAADGSLIESVPRAHSGGNRVRSLQWSPNSQFLASIAERDRVIRLWKNPLSA